MTSLKARKNLNRSLLTNGLRLQQSTDYGPYLANVASPLHTTTIVEQCTEKLTDDWSRMRCNVRHLFSLRPLCSFSSHTYMHACDSLCKSLGPSFLQMLHAPIQASGHATAARCLEICHSMMQIAALFALHTGSHDRCKSGTIIET